MEHLSRCSLPQPVQPFNISAPKITAPQNRWANRRSRSALARQNSQENPLELYIPVVVPGG